MEDELPCGRTQSIAVVTRGGGGADQQPGMLLYNCVFVNDAVLFVRSHRMLVHFLQEMLAKSDVFLLDFVSKQY